MSTATIPTAIFIEMPIGWIGLRMTTHRHQSLNHSITIVICSLFLSLPPSLSLCLSTNRINQGSIIDQSLILMICDLHTIIDEVDDDDDDSAR